MTEGRVEERGICVRFVCTGSEEARSGLIARDMFMRAWALEYSPGLDGVFGAAVAFVTERRRLDLGSGAADAGGLFEARVEGSRGEAPATHCGHWD